MARQKALIRLHKSLLAWRERLCEKRAGDLAYLGDWNAASAAGDSADLAFEADGGEISSRLTDLDDRELSQIERALARWNQGLYGICEGGSWKCQKEIPVGRLNALPYATYCIQCERALELRFDVRVSPGTGSWDQIDDAQAPMRDERINFGELERDVSGSRQS
jgi:DnaK suppressor protein